MTVFYVNFFNFGASAFFPFFQEKYATKGTEIADIQLSQVK